MVYCFHTEKCTKKAIQRMLSMLINVTGKGKIQENDRAELMFSTH